MQIQKILSENPALIASASEQAEELRLEWLKLKEQLSRDEARSFLVFKAQEAKRTVREVEAMVDTNDEIYSLRLSVLQAESNYRKKETEISHLKEELNASKMLARIQMAEWESTFELKGAKNGL
jgi:hypothetical protein